MVRRDVRGQLTRRCNVETTLQPFGYFCKSDQNNAAWHRPFFSTAENVVTALVPFAHFSKSCQTAAARLRFSCMAEHDTGQVEGWYRAGRELVEGWSRAGQGLVEGS